MGEADVGALLPPREDHHVGVRKDSDAAANDYSRTHASAQFNSRAGRGRRGAAPVAPISPMATTLCARSAQMRPRSTSRSKVETCASLACCAAPRRRATRCCGVSGAAASVGLAGGVRVKACGPVAVKRVASATERGGAIVRGVRGVGGCVVVRGEFYIRRGWRWWSGGVTAVDVKGRRARLVGSGVDRTRRRESRIGNSG